MIGLRVSAIALGATALASFALPAALADTQTPAPPATSQATPAKPTPAPTVAKPSLSEPAPTPTTGQATPPASTPPTATTQAAPPTPVPASGQTAKPSLAEPAPTPGWAEAGPKPGARKGMEVRGSTHVYARRYAPYEPRHFATRHYAWRHEPRYARRGENPVAAAATGAVGAMADLGSIAAYPVYCFPNYGSCPVHWYRY